MIQAIKQQLIHSPIEHSPLPEDHSKLSAVFLLLRNTPEPEILFVQRAQTLRHHPGEIGFPGGKVDALDRHLLDTAHREVEEEIGITANHIEAIAQLKKQRTRYGLWVTPFVGIIEPEVDFAPDQSEIDHVFSVPVNHFFNADHRRYKHVTYRRIPLKFPGYTYQNHHIWGLTHRVLVDFLNEGLNARLTPRPSSIRWPWQK